MFICVVVGGVHWCGATADDLRRLINVERRLCEDVRPDMSAVHRFDMRRAVYSTSAAAHISIGSSPLVMDDDSLACSRSCSDNLRSEPAWDEARLLCEKREKRRGMLRAGID